MKKISRKIVSVFLAFMLVLGIFSVILPTARIAPSVNAETAQQTFDYSVLLGDKSRGAYLADTRILHDSDGIDAYGIFGSQGIAVRASGSLGVYDGFFSGTAIGAKADEIHPYLIYNVVPGTSFKLSSAGYNDTVHKTTGCNDNERFFNLYVSNDGVTWIPITAKREFTGVWSGSASYDTYLYTIDNVGAKTNFVKVEYPMTMASRRAPNYVYVPNESLTVTSVTLTRPETYNANGETLFQAKLYSTQKELYDKYFITFPEIMCADTVSDPENLLNHYKAATVTFMSDVAWGTYEDEKARSYVTMVEPGSRFYLETANQTYMRNIGQAMVNSGEISSIDQARIRVYTSATLSDDAADWTEHNPMAYSLIGNAATTPTFNFYLPEKHIYVKIVYPHKGDFRTVMLNGSAAAGEVGNTGCFFNDIAFTPYVKSEATETYDYTVSGTTGYTNTPLVVETANGIRAKNDGSSKNLPNGHTSNANAMFGKGHFATIYAVEGEKMFSLEYAIRMTKEKNGYGKGAYEANAPGHKMGFEISVSSDGENWSHPYKLLPTYTETAETIGTSEIRIYDIDYIVPENAKFIRVDYDLVGNGYIYTNADKTAEAYRYFNDAMLIRKVSISDAHTSVTENLKYVYTTDTDATLGTYNKNNVQVSTRTENGGYTGFNPTWGYLKQNKSILAGTIDRASVVYDIMPGTPINFDFSMRYQAIAMSEESAAFNLAAGLAKENLLDYEFYVYGRDKDAGDTWTFFGKTDSDGLTLSGATSSYNTFGFGNFEFDFPDYVNQVKIEFPQTGGYNQNASKYYDYSSSAYSGSYNASNCVNIGAAAVSGSPYQICKEVGKPGLEPNWSQLKIEWGTGNFYVVYKVASGTKFIANFQMANSASRQKWADANGEPFEFKVEASASIDSGWKNPVTTEGQETAPKIVYDVPTDCSYVKITFPQKGILKGSTDTRLNDMARLTSVRFYETKAIACGNDGAYLYNMQFVSPNNGIIGDYVNKETSNIASADKKDLSIYHYGGVSIVKGEGIKATTNNAFVIYKIKEGTILTLKSEDNLSFAYSTDDVTYRPFEAVYVNGSYKIPAIAGRNYIKVKLENSESISYADAEIAPPTAKFYIPYLNKYELVDFADYGSAANSVSSTLDMLRPGYTFTNWSGLDSADPVYIDTVFEAVFVKDADVSFNVDWTVNGQTETKTDVKFDDKITITAPRESGGKVFVKWIDSKRNTVSDNPTFTFLASGNISLTAVYADSKEAIDPYIYMTDEPVITVNEDKTWNLSVVWRSAMPRDVSIVETGILLGTDVDKAGLVLWDGKAQSGTVKMVHKNTAANKTAMYTVKNIKPGNMRTALPFARLSTGAVIYANNVLKVKDGVKVTDSSFEFYGKISPEVLSNYLDRSLTYHAFDTTGATSGQTYISAALYGTKDVIRQTGAKYFARALCHWVPAANNDSNFSSYRNYIAQIHDMDPEIIMEACIFETCGPEMNNIAIPTWVFEAFGKTPETRNFDYNLMRHEDHAATSGLLSTNFLEGYGWNQWGENRHIPSISTEEFQMFVYYRACRYIDMGIEAIHFGQMNLIGAITEYEKDSTFSKTGHWKVTGVDNAAWTKVIDMINAYAKTNARRGYLIVNGHYPNQNLTRSDDSSKMLVDFNMFPLRIAAKTGSTAHTPSEGFQEVMLQTSGDAPYTASRQTNAANKTSPSGYTYANYPYLLEFDNWGVNDITKLNTMSGAWGYDEISWYANQNAEERHQFLMDISLQVKNLASAPNGHVAMPGRRTAFIHKDGCSEFLEQEWVQSFINDEANTKYLGIGVQHPLWDIRTAGDVPTLKEVWRAIGSYGTSYDYTDDGDALISITNANKTEYGISALGGPALVNNESGGNAIFRGIHPGWGSLGTDWSDSATAPYVIYKVKPGTIMNIDLYMFQAGKTAFENAGHNFDFTIECAASETGSYKNAITTDSYTAQEFSILYEVPTDCKYVKITFPQKGKLSGTSGARGNDYARIMGVRFIAQ